MTAQEPRPTGGLLSASVEIIVHILQRCHSSRDLVALVSTCRHVYLAWRGNVAAAIWPLWLREIPHFEDAIMAARMTALVVEAERRGELPPTRISPGQPQLQHQQPSLSEVTAAFGLYVLSRGVASCFCMQHLERPDCWADEPRGDCHPGRDWFIAGDGWSEEWCCSPSEGRSQMPEWRARVSHAVFRLLIVGAALTGAYQEPLFRAREHPDPDIQALAQRAQRVAPGVEGRGTLTQKEMDFLLQFAVCDLDATLEAQDAVFGPIADWLLESILSDETSRQAMTLRFEERRGRARFCLEEAGHYPGCPLGTTLADGRGTHSDVHLIVWELMKMMWLVSRIRLDSPWYGIFDRDTPCPPSSRGADAGGSRWGPLETESAVAVYFGVFRAEETFLKPVFGSHPRVQSWMSDRLYMKTYPAVPATPEQDRGDGKHSCRASSVQMFFDHIFAHSGRPNHFENFNDTSPVAPLELKFFEYFLQRHLGLCFDCDFFGPQDFVSMEIFEATATIFSQDDVESRHPMQVYLNHGDFLDGSELLIGHPPPSERVYQAPRRL